MAATAYPNPQPMLQVVDRLAEACTHPSHAFWPQQRNVLVGGPIHWPSILKPRQIATRKPWGLLPCCPGDENGPT